MCTTYGLHDIARQVLQLDPNTGCTVLFLQGGDEPEDITCDDAGMDALGILSRMFVDTGYLRAYATAISTADLCAQYSGVAYAETRTVQDLLAMATGMDTDGSTRLRVLYLLDSQAPCAGCDVDGVWQRVARTFVEKDGLVYVVVAAPASSDHAGMDCDTSETESQTLVAGALGAVGSCGTYAWRCVLL
jgi:hypothetical protein